MTEATWGDATKTPEINWSMSAALENVQRGGTDLAEVTSLRLAVEAWQDLDPLHQGDAVLTPEHPIMLDGVSFETLDGEGIRALAERLPD